MEKLVQSETKAEVAIYLSENGISSLRECKNKFQYRNLSLNIPGFESKKFTKEAVKYMAEYLKNGGDTDNCSSVLEKYFANYYVRKWFPSDVEWESEKERDFRRVFRLVDYIVSNSYHVVEVSKPYQGTFSRPIRYKNILLAGVRGVFDLVLEKDGKYVLVSLQEGKSPYSVKAMKEEKLSINSMELLTIQIAGYTTYTNFIAQLWYMGNKDDTGKNLSDFEHRKGKNIVTADFSKKTPGEVFNHFLNILSKEKECDCSKCLYASICQVPVLRTEDTIFTTKQGKFASEKKFTTFQEEVINHTNGPMCVIAVPGAGKTTALVYRLVKLIEKGVKPEKILMLTFTKKAAKEIFERVNALLGGQKELPTISTYNALGFSILKENSIYVGGRRLKLADDIDRYRMIYDALTTCNRINGFSYAGINTEHGLVRQIDTIFSKIDKMGEEEYISQYEQSQDVDGIIRVYQTYKNIYEKNCFIDFNDQITLVNRLFEENPDLAQHYGYQYEYIMVDEFQDTSVEQADMIYTMAKYSNNLVVVGDDDQAIYGWRGGSSEFMLNFQKDFPDAKMVYMEDNFRSSSTILELADSIMCQQTSRYKKSLKSHKFYNNKPVYVKGVPKDIISMVSSLLKQGVQPGEICILGRKNSRLNEVERLLEGVAPVTTPKDYLVKDAVFLVVLDMLSLYYKGLDTDVSFYRVMKYMDVGIVSKKGNSLYQSMIDAGKLLPIEDSSECRSCYVKYENENSGSFHAGYCILKSFEKIKSAGIKEAICEIVKCVFGFSEHRVIDAIMDLVDERGITNLKELYGLMQDMIIYQVPKRVGYDVSENAINLLTCHDSKGKEFNYVILYCVEDFNMESESLRCLYVAVTRAKKGMYMLEGSSTKEKELFNTISPYMNVVSF